MKYIITLAFILAITLLGGCSLHDGKGWEHTGDQKTEAVDQPYTLTHEH